MKAITRSQWDRMNVFQRSWLINRLMEKPCQIYWHCVDPEGKTVGGSYPTASYCSNLIAQAKELTEKDAAELGCEFPHPFAACRPKPTLAFAHAAEFDHIAVEYLQTLFVGPGKEVLTIRMVQDGDGLAVGVYAGEEAAFGSSIAEAGCLLILDYFGCFQED